MTHLCRKYNIAPTTFCTWKEKFIEGGKNAITGDARGKRKYGVSSNGTLQKENDDLKKIVGELVYQLAVYYNCVTGTSNPAAIKHMIGS